MPTASTTETAPAKEKKTKNQKLRQSIFNMLEAGEDPGFVRFVHGKVADLSEVEDDITEYKRLITGEPAPAEETTREDLGTGEIRKRYESAIIAKEGVENYKKLYDEVTKDNTLLPTEIAGEDAARLKSAHRLLLFDLATAQGTGALQAPDRELVEDALPDVTTANPLKIAEQKIRGGKEGNIAAFDAIIKRMDEISSSLLGNAENPTTQQPQRVVPVNPDFQGDSDSFSQAMAMAQQMPDDPRSKKFLDAVNTGRIDKSTGRLVDLSPGAQTATGLSTLPSERQIVDPETDEVKMGGFFDKISQPWAPAAAGDTPTVAGLKTAVNVIPSAIGFGKGVLEFLNPLNTVETAQELGSQAGEALGSGEMSGTELLAETAKGIPEAAGKVLLPQFLRDIFKGDTASAAQAMENDPVGQIAPLLLVARGVAQKKGMGGQFDAAISKIASPVTKTGEVVGAGAKAMATKPVKFATSQATGISPETISRIIADPQSFSKEARTTITRRGLAEEVETNLKTLEADLGETGKQYAPVRESGKVVTVEPAFLENIIKETTGLDIKKGKVTANTKSKFRDTGDVRAVQKLYNDWSGVFKKGQLAADEFLNLRSDLAGLSKFERQMGKSEPVEAATQIMRGKLNETYRPQMDGLEKLDKEFSAKSTEFKELRKGILDKNGELTPAAINRIANSAGKGKDLLAEQLEQITPGITEKVKLLKAFEDIEAASGQKVGAYARAGVGVTGVATMNPAMIVGSILAIPEVAVPILRGIGMTAEKIGPVLKTLGVPFEKLNDAPSLIPDASKKKDSNLQIASHERAKNLTPEWRSIEDAAFSKIDKQEAKILSEYQKKNGNVVNADSFRPYFKEEGYAGHNAAAVQEPASELAKKAFANGLKNEGKYATFYAGGSGTGKTSAIKNIPEAEKVKQQSSVILDGNLSSYDSAVKKINQAEKAGKKTPVFFVYRDPVEAFVEGVVKRMLRNEEEMGRLVPSKVVAGNHIDSWNVVKRLKDEGKNGMFFIDNSRGAGKAKLVPFEELAKKVKFPSQEKLTAILNKEAKKLYDEGTISKEQYEGYIQ